MNAERFVPVGVDEILKITETAILVSVEDRQVWLPRYAVEDASSFEAGDLDVEMSVAESVARRKGLWEY